MSAYNGTFNQSSPTDITLGLLDTDTSFAVTFEHSRFLSGKGMDEKEYAHIQCAVLYTTVGGQRRVRTINVAVQVASLAANVFRFADLDATVCLWTKEGKLTSLRVAMGLVCPTLD